MKMFSRELRKKIKFRVWHEERFHYWGFFDEQFVPPPCDCGDDADLVERKSQQYTGMKDKWGTEIYVGDIVDVSSFGIRDKKYYIISSVFGFGEDYGVACNRWTDSDCEVIGNIYENRDILSQAVRRR
jgi:hypothetical protein